MKNIVIALLLLIITALALNTVFGWFTLSEDERIARETLSPKNDTIRLETTINKDSTVYVKYQPNVGELPVNNITKNYQTYVYDTLAPALKIATSKIAELQQIKAKLEGTVQSQKTEIDKEKVRTIYFKDRYFSATTKTDSTGKSSLNYNYDAQLDVVTTTKKRLLRSDLQEIYITSPDKNLKINGVEHFKKDVKIPESRIGLGVQAGYYFVPEIGKIQPAVGVGVSYNLVKF